VEGGHRGFPFDDATIIAGGSDIEPDLFGKSANFYLIYVIDLAGGSGPGPHPPTRLYLQGIGGRVVLERRKICFQLSFQFANVF
jgi:hypothetical protein